MGCVYAVNGADEFVQAGELIIRPGQHIVIARGRVLSFSVREMQLLVFLARNPGRVIPRNDLFEQAWGTPYEHKARSIDVYVHKIRNKLAEALPQYVFIHTHHGFGYRFQVESSQDFHNSDTIR